ncbi:hypothetical protein FRB98_007967 [Tulasnella sp. 332]|nr:hypothetical protein FRB98_007967 [Tulasnella sp. 332]
MSRSGQPGPSEDSALERGDQSRPNLRPRRRSPTRYYTCASSHSTQIDPPPRGVRFIDLTANGQSQEEENAEIRNGLANEVPAAILDRAGTIWTVSNVGSRNDNGVMTRRESTPIAALKRMSWKEQMSSLMVPRKKVGAAPSFISSLLAIVFFSWLSVLLVFVPVSDVWPIVFFVDRGQWALYLIHFNDTVVFITAFLGIIPLANLLSFATDELTIRVGETLGGLISITLGNVIESIVAGFKIAAAQVHSGLLNLCIMALIIPTSYYFSLPDTYTEDSAASNDAIGQQILDMSHGIAVILEFIYTCGLAYQLRTHSYLFDERSKLAETARPTLRFPNSNHDSNHNRKIFILHTPHLPDHLHDHMPQRKTGGAETPGVYAIVVTEEPEELPGVAPDEGEEREEGAGQLAAQSREQGEDIHLSPISPVSPLSHTSTPTSHMAPKSPESPRYNASELEAMKAVAEDEENLTVVHVQEEGEEIPQMSVWVTLILIFVVTAAVSVSALFMVDSISGLVATTALSAEWVGLVLLPMVGNASAHVTELFQGVADTVEDKLDRSISHAIGSSIQLALFVLPFVVILGWYTDKPLTLLFDPFEAACLVYAVLIVKVVIAAGHSDWLKGVVLICLYIIIAVALWFYPGEDTAASILMCS